MRYVAEVTIICPESEYPPARAILRKRGLDSPWSMPVKVQCEKDELEALVSDLQGVGQKAHVSYRPAFDPSEVDSAELLRVFVVALCGPGFSQWAAQLQLPVGTLVMDKRQMRKQDIARTYLFEVVISDHLRKLLADSGLAGWRTEAIQHVDATRDRFGPLYALTATSQLPSLSRETELHIETHENLPQHDPLFGTRGLFQRSPLFYRREDILTFADFNRTSELFGEAPEAHPFLIISQRAWRVFQKHNIRNFEVEPVVILD